jgi:hypothetical protein
LRRLQKGLAAVAEAIPLAPAPGAALASFGTTIN